MFLRSLARRCGLLGTGVAAFLALAGGAGATSLATVDHAQYLGIYEITNTFSADVGDFNRDGLPDFLLVRHWQEKARLYANSGTGFREMLRGTFVRRDRHHCTWRDVNGDDLPDAYCTIGADHGTAVKSNELWIQQSSGGFVDRAAAYGVSDPYGRGRATTFVDVDHDQYADLFVGNIYPRRDSFSSQNRLFLNTGGDGFRSAPELGVDLEVGGTCAQAADYNQDGWEDLLVCGQTALHLYRNNAGTSFTDVASSVHASAAAADAELVDVNGDGRLDLVTVRPAELKISLQQGGVFQSSVTRALSAGHAIASGDVDGDRRPDLYVLQGCGSTTTNYPDLLLVNNGFGTGFDDASIPEATTGCGDTVSAIDENIDGRAEFIVLNGSKTTPGPVQLIVGARPRLAIDDVTTAEGDLGSKAASFRVSLSGPSGRPVTVDYTTADATATAPDDYTAVSGTLTFDPGQTTKTISVPVRGDTLDEGDESFMLTLGNANGGLLADAQATGMIVDDDLGPCGVSGTTLYLAIPEAGSATIGLSGSTFAVSGVGSDPTCGGATVTTVDAIEVTGSRGNETLDLDLSGGRFAPGKTTERTGSSEIEIHVDLRSGASDKAFVDGGVENDSIVTGAAGINLNFDDDSDVVLAGVESLGVRAGAGDDRLVGYGGRGTGSVYTSPLTLDGGSGSDSLVGGSSGDKLIGGGDADALAGNSGNDTLDGGLGADVLNGDAGRDRVTYASRASSVAVWINGVADDGALAEGDNVGGDVEIVKSGAGNDLLVANSAANRLLGGAGKDVLRGLGGADVLVGGLGADLLEGGGAGDTLGSRDNGSDNADCGAGVDTSNADIVDLVSADCEIVSRG